MLFYEQNDILSLNIEPYFTQKGEVFIPKFKKWGGSGIIIYII